MNKLTALALSCLMFVPFSSRAESQTFEGNIESAQAVVRIPLTLDTALAHVAIWTDSFQYAQHFDPVIALWRDGTRIGLNDDRSDLMPGQSWFDSGLYFDTLPGGSFVLTITNYANFPVSSALSDGFRYDVPGAVIHPLNNCPAKDNCPGNYWRLHLQDNIMAVPEPSAWRLYLCGLLLLAGRLPGAWRRRANSH